MRQNRKSRLIERIGIAVFLASGTFSMTIWQGSAWTQDAVGLYSNMVGVKYVNVNEGWNILSLPLIPSTLAEGEVTETGAGMIADSSASWIADELAGHYVRVASGVQRFSYFIIGNTETDLTVSGDPQADGVSPGDTYDVRPALEGIFGGVDGPLTAGDGAVTPSDEIVAWDAAAQKVGESALLRDIPGTEFQGWLDLVWNPSELNIDADMGFWVRHHGAAVGLPVYGEVATTDRVVTVEAGWNILGVSIPVAEALNVDGLDQTQLDLFGHAGDMILELADQIAIWDSASQRIVDSGFLSLVTGYEGWRDSVWDPSSIVIVPGQGFWYWALEDFAWADIPLYVM